MKDNIKENRKNLKELLDRIIATNDKNITLPLDEALDSSINMIIEQAKNGRKVLFIGNGGSASIASHMAIDFWKNAGIRALSFNDSSLLTCISNDYGYKHVFEKPIEMFSNAGDILFAISSSGKSENILRGIVTAKGKGLKILALSGFAEDNPMRKLGDINFYVPSVRYGHVEIAHLFICHCLVDAIIERKYG